jgi:hypothetical protein
MQRLTNQLVKIGRLRAIRVSEKEQLFYRNLNEPEDLNDRPRRRRDPRSLIAL